ncbi:unnamed protein product [Anisakis simplex]|uniref:LITAF domain-containing protein n=1 Tax=Anisakis simplex TaxID=6269 RepID=A0A0M3J5Y8_ANISI|nr:unnamed protein product [Anisakis simplex]
MADHEEDENVPLLNNEATAPSTPNYEGVNNPDDGANEEGERIYTRPEEHFTEPQHAPITPSDENPEASRVGGPTVTCRVCSALIHIEGKVETILIRRNSLRLFYLISSQFTYKLLPSL